MGADAAHQKVETSMLFRLASIAQTKNASITPNRPRMLSKRFAQLISIRVEFLVSMKTDDNEWEIEEMLDVMEDYGEPTWTENSQKPCRRM